MIAGNLAFKQAATGAADTGAERAFNELPALAAADVDVPNKYYRLMQAVDSTACPAASTGPACPAGARPAAATRCPCSDAASYRVQYVIDRLCTSAPVPGDPAGVLAGKCVSGQPFSTAGSAGSDNSSHAQTTHVFGGVTPVSPTRPTIHYRVTVRVQGPRNTTSTVQTIVELPFG